jgi:hypothetical protein
MTDNEIIKALSICYDYNFGGCENCPYYGKWLSCGELKAKDALDLINRQKAEIERLQKENNQFADIGKMYSEIKAEAIKEFAERLKGHFNPDSSYDIRRFIDNLVEEIIKGA